MSLFFFNILKLIRHSHKSSPFSKYLNREDISRDYYSSSRIKTKISYLFFKNLKIKILIWYHVFWRSLTRQSNCCSRVAVLTILEISGPWANMLYLSSSSRDIFFPLASRSAPTVSEIWTKFHKKNTMLWFSNI